MDIPDISDLIQYSNDILGKQYLSYNVQGNVYSFEENNVIVYSCIKQNPYDITIIPNANIILKKQQNITLRAYLFPVKKTNLDEIPFDCLDILPIENVLFNWKSNVQPDNRLIVTVRWSILSSQAGNAFKGPNRRYICLRINNIQVSDTANNNAR